MTDFLSADDLVQVAQRVVGRHVEVADYGLLASAAARPQASAFGQAAYPDLETQAAALLVSLVRNHSLVDGNKRLGWAAAVVFLELNGLDLRPPSQDALVDFVVDIAASKLGDDLLEVREVLAGWTSQL